MFCLVPARKRLFWSLWLKRNHQEQGLRLMQNLWSRSEFLDAHVKAGLVQQLVFSCKHNLAFGIFGDVG